jgi:hypothetical protein
MQYVPPKCQWTSTRLHGITSRNTVFFIVTTVITLVISKQMCCINQKEVETEEDFEKGGMNMWNRNRLDCHEVRKNYVILYCETEAYCLVFMYVISSGSKSYDITAQPSQIIRSSNSLLLLAVYCCSSVTPTVEREGRQRTCLRPSRAEMCSGWNHVY